VCKKSSTQPESAEKTDSVPEIVGGVVGSVVVLCIVVVVILDLLRHRRKDNPQDDYITAVASIAELQPPNYNQAFKTDDGCMVQSYGREEIETDKYATLPISHTNESLSSGGDCVPPCNINQQRK